MKLITWNCNMAFRKKADAILAHKPDILVVPECEHPDKLIFRKQASPSDSLWFGTNQHKGLGIFSFSRYRFTLLDIHDPSLKMIVPLLVTGGEIDFILYAVWANNPGDPDGPYVGQVWKAIHRYDIHLSGTAAILAGDFNSNAIWDRPRRKGNHSHVVNFLAEKRIVSAYHLHHRQEQGKEKHPTQYMYRHKDKPYHLDYCFVSDHFSGKIKSVEVGDHRDWSRYSDHVPLIVEFRRKRRSTVK